ncbi:MAG: nitrous oxide reductase accessory protein NosL [Campylobacterales bacterium]|nr:nitrous oxide reductase accessory protein NosL [Campylobacterales bacterium]
MKKLLSLVIALSSVVFAMGDPAGKPTEVKEPMMMKMFQSVDPAKAQILQDGKNKMYCPLCGMTLPMFYKTNHAATHKGHTKQYCSMHCLANDKANGVELSDIKVVDTATLAFIDATKAFYVVGSSKKGTMSMVSKYAFGTKEGADAFAKEFGGEVKSFDEALKIATDALAKTNEMLKNKRLMVAKHGKQAYEKLCKPTDQKFATVADAKAYIEQNKLCGDIKGKKLQAIAIYLTSLK